MKAKTILILFTCLVLLGTMPAFSEDTSSKDAAKEATENDEKGKKLFDNKQYTEAYPFFKKAADAGNSDAMMHLGKMYYNGWGVLHNHATGKMWHEKAAALGNKESIEKLKKMDMHEHGH